MNDFFVRLDDRGRYAYDCQPDICKWNCQKFAEALEPVLSMSLMEEVLETYDEQYNEFYHRKMMKKVCHTFTCNLTLITFCLVVIVFLEPHTAFRW